MNQVLEAEESVAELSQEETAYESNTPWKLCPRAVFTSPDGERAVRYEFSLANISIEYLQPLSEITTEESELRLIESPIKMMLRLPNGEECAQIELRTDTAEARSSLILSLAEQARNQAYEGEMKPHELREFLTGIVLPGVTLSSRFGESPREIADSYRRRMRINPPTKQHSPIVRAVTFDSEGVVAELNPSPGELSFDEIRKKGEICWIDIQHPSPELLERLRNEYGLDDRSIADCLRFDGTTEMARGNEYRFFGIHEFSMDSSSKAGLLPSEVHFFAGKDFVITVHDKNSPALNNAREELLDRDVPVLGGGTVPLVNELIDCVLVENRKLYAQLQDQIQSLYEKLQRESLSNDELVETLPRIGQAARRLWKSLSDEQDLPETLDRFLSNGKEKGSHPATQRLSERYADTVRDVESLQHELSDLMSTNAAIINRQQNGIMQKLAIASALALPVVVADALSSLSTGSIVLAGAISLGLLARAWATNWMPSELRK